MAQTVLCTETNADSTCRIVIAGSIMPRQATITPEDVDTRWPFRAGYPRLLRPPVISITIPNEDEKPISDANFERLKPHIDAILEAYNIPHRDGHHELVYRKQKYGTSALPRVIVGCTYDKETSHSDMWARAVTEIYAATQSMVEGDIEVGVELFDPLYMSTSHICAPPPSESQELSLNWERGYNYCEQILRWFESPGQMFQTMLPTGRCSAGEREYEWTTVIYFSALDAEDRAWDYIEERIRSILPSHIGIEIRQRAGPLFCNDDGDDDATQQSVQLGQGGWDSSIADMCRRPPRPGCEISRQGDHESGTMGGYIVTEAQDTKERTTYGVTNAHVALGSNEECTFKKPAGSGIVMQSPGEKFRERKKSMLSNKISVLEKELQDLKNMAEAYEEQDPAFVKQLKKKLRTKEPKLAPPKRKLHFIEQDPYIGSVHHARLGDRNISTTASPCKIAVDIALIKMSCLADKPPQEIFLKENDDTPSIEDGTTCNFWEVDSLGEPSDAKKHIKVVAKISRSGTYSMGIVSDFQARVFSLQKNGVQTKEKLYSWAILGPRHYTEALDLCKPGPAGSVGYFTNPGDSGSFIMAAADWEYGGFDNRVTMPSKKVEGLSDSDACEPFLVGLLYAAEIWNDVTFFIPFDVVKSEIESMTGEEMVWPQNRTEYLEELEQYTF